MVDVDSGPPYVNALDIDPSTRELLLTTNRGFWRISSDGAHVTRVRGELRARGREAPIGSSVVVAVGRRRELFASGHPDVEGTFPGFLGLLRSGDGGRSWRVVSGLGEADHHKLVVRHGRIYAYDAVPYTFVVSEDEGRSFAKRSTPPGVVTDFDVDPTDGDRIAAAMEDQLFRSDDGGRTWRPLIAASGMRVAWAARDELYRADQDGRVHVSADAGDTWSEVGRVDGEPAQLKAVGPDSAYMAMSDGAIARTDDGGRTWADVFRP